REPGAGFGKRRCGRRRRGRVALEAQVARQQYLFRVPPEVRAVLMEYVPLVREFLDRAADEVPMLGEAGRSAQRALLAAAADADRRGGAPGALVVVNGPPALAGG